jgi:dCTP deaminase
MGVLSNVALDAALASGRLIIRPRPSLALDKRETRFGTCSIDLSLADQIYVARRSLDLSFDLRSSNLQPTLETVYERRRLPETGWPLEPQRMILGSTLEDVTLPLGENGLAARIEGRSSFARAGLLVHFTAPTIHPGFSGTITLEMINLGAIPLMLRPGLRVCQLIVETVEGTPIRADSQFQGQRRATGARAKSERARPARPRRSGRSRSAR